VALNKKLSPHETYRTVRRRCDPTARRLAEERKEALVGNPSVPDCRSALRVPTRVRGGVWGGRRDGAGGARVAVACLADVAAGSAGRRAAGPLTVAVRGARGGASVGRCRVLRRRGRNRLGSRGLGGGRAGVRETVIDGRFRTGTGEEQRTRGEGRGHGEERGGGGAETSGRGGIRGGGLHGKNGLLEDAGLDNLRTTNKPLT
jgi:hypothetical protein